MGMQESKSFCANYPQKWKVDFDGIGHAVETCWSDESYTYIMPADQCSRERIQ